MTNIEKYAHGPARRAAQRAQEAQREAARLERLQAELDTLRWTPAERVAFHDQLQQTTERPAWAIGEVGMGWDRWFRAHLLRHREVEVCLWAYGQPLDQVRAWMGWGGGA